MVLETRNQNRTVTGPVSIASLIDDLSATDGITRRRAREALVERGDPAVPTLIEALSDSNSQVRWEAAKILGLIGDPAAAPALVRAMRDEDSGVCWLAGHSLIKIGPGGLEPLLRALIAHPQYVWFRECAYHVIQRLRNGEHLGPRLQPVLEALRGIEPRVQVPVAAYRALQALKNGRLDEPVASRERA